MKIEELENKIREFRLLQNVANNYRDMIKTIGENEETFNVCSIGYTVNNIDFEYFNLSNLSLYKKNILTRYVIEGLSASLDSIKKEIEELRVEIEKNDG